MDQIRVPMQAVSSGNQRGRIAWWTSDESAKAKINAGSDSSIASNPLFDAQSPQHVGHQAIPALENFAWKQGQRSIAISNGVVNLAAGLSQSGLGNLNHGVTVHSAGVLADVRGGHLKRDLSSLLARPLDELANNPLYVVNGRINRFMITEEGVISNAAGVTTSGTDANRWGINLEELHLFHNLHREIDWSSGKPRLLNSNSKEAIVQDRFFLYKQPVIEAVHIILSFRAVPDSAPDTFKIESMMDAMVALSNPNDVPIVWQPNTRIGVDMHSLPYYVRWNIRRKDGTARHTHRTNDMNVPFFKSTIRNGFTLEPGEAGVFGNSLADTASRQRNLTRGFVPRGGVRINDGEWGRDTKNVGLRATGLLKDDTIDFTLIKSTGGHAASGFIMCPKTFSNNSGGAWTINTLFNLRGSSQYNELLNQYMLNEIKPPQRLNVEEFVGKPMPVMMITMMPNVEKSRTDIQPANAVPSRPFHFREPAYAFGGLNTNSLADHMHLRQWLIITEPMDYEFGNDRTLAAGDGGRNLYHGGARDVGRGGNFRVIKRRVPLAPPLSIGAFENAAASGFMGRFTQGPALNGTDPTLPAFAKVIGNSWSNPFLASDSVFSGAYHDPSWMANTALWDSWFLSGIVDGGASASSPWINDSRSQRQQFRELAENAGSPRNGRLIHHPHKSTEDALDELFNGEVLKPSAIHKLAKYLLVDGSFNVNSTSLTAWKAFLASVRE